MTPSSPEPPHIDLPAQRRLKLEQLRSKGIDPFTNGLRVDFECGEIAPRVQNGSLAMGTVLSVAGRVGAIRNMGKSSFLDLRDATGRIQIFVPTKELSEVDDTIWRQLDLGDILGVTGELFLTRTGELSVRVRSLVLLAKALQPFSAKFHGLNDLETRHRQRYL